MSEQLDEMAQPENCGCGHLECPGVWSGECPLPAEKAQHDHDPRTCDGCLMLTMVRRAERAEATLRAWGIQPNAEVDERFRRNLAEINRAEGRSVIGTDRTPSDNPSSPGAQS